jgi:recombination protein RecT
MTDLKKTQSGKIEKEYPKGKAGEMERYIDAIAPRLERCSTRHLKPAELTASFLVACAKNRAIYDCSRESVALALGVCAELGLRPNTFAGHIYMIPYKGVLQAQLGYKGLIELVRRTGQIDRINAQVFYKQEVANKTVRVSIEPPRIEHDWTPDEYPSDDIAGAYCTIWLRGATSPIIEIMGRAALDRLRARSAAVKANKSSPWDTDPDRMHRKGVIKRAVNGGTVPISAEMMEDSRLAKAIDYDNEGFVETEATVVTSTKATRAAELYAPKPAPEAIKLTDEQVRILGDGGSLEPSADVIEPTGDEDPTPPSDPPKRRRAAKQATEAPQDAPPQRRRATPPPREPQSLADSYQEPGQGAEEPSEDPKPPARPAAPPARRRAARTPEQAAEHDAARQADDDRQREELFAKSKAKREAAAEKGGAAKDDPIMDGDAIIAAFTAAGVSWDDAYEAQEELGFPEDWAEWTVSMVKTITARVIGADAQPGLAPDGGE